MMLLYQENACEFLFFTKSDPSSEYIQRIRLNICKYNIFKLLITFSKIFGCSW